MSKILLVEDNEMNRDMLARRLQRRGYEVVGAVNGQEAVDKTTEIEPDLILMDLSLPVMDGWEATKILKDQSETADIPVIALTAHALESDRTKALEIGCDEFETKPVDIGRLLEKMQDFLDE